ncbi:AAA family ATPase [Microbacterium sp. C23T]
MRIVVSGTHASGKSTLIADFSAAHPEFEVLSDPYELLDEAGDEPDAGLFVTQLGISARRLLEFDPSAKVIAERGPLDFLAYLTALDELGRASRPGGHPPRAVDLAVAAMAHVDLLVLLPLDGDIRVPEDEDPELREAMDDALLELSDDPDLLGGARVIEVAGDPGARLAQVETAIADIDGR